MPEEILAEATREAIRTVLKLKPEIQALAKRILDHHDNDQKCFFDRYGERTAILPEC